MGLRFDPMGGGQFKNAVKQIIEAERQPIHQVETRKAREEARLKLFQDFKQRFSTIERALSEFSDFKKFRELKSDLGAASEYIGLTLDKDHAEPGTYTIQVDQLAKRSSVISNSFASPDEAVLGIGFVVFELPDGDTKEIFVDGDNASLKNVASLINNQKDSPVQAAVIRDDGSPGAPFRLMMTAKKDGAQQNIQFPEVYFLDGDQDFYFDDRNDAENALLTIDGFEVEVGTNEIKDFLPGVNLHLKQAAPDRPFTVKITQDYQKISGKVKNLVDQVNNVLEFINKQNQVDDKTDTRSSFAGDSSLQTIEYRLRNILHDGFPVGNWDETPDQFLRLSDLGVEFTKTGALQFKEEKFQKLLENNFDNVTEAITGEFGFAKQLREVIGAYTQTNTGALALREQGLKNRIKQLDSEISAKEARLAQREERLVARFSRLQGSLNDLQRQQQALSSMGGGGGGGGIMSLLGG